MNCNAAAVASPAMRSFNLLYLHIVFHNTEYSTLGEMRVPSIFLSDVTCATAETKMIGKRDSPDNVDPEHTDTTADAAHC